MKSAIGIGVAAFVFLAVAALFQSMRNDQPVSNTSSTTPMNERTEPEIVPISHATAVITWGDRVIYTDPVGEAKAFAGKPPADIVLVTDIHGDHFSTSTLAAVVGPDTSLVVPQAVMDQLPPDLASRATIEHNGDTHDEKGFSISAVAMYNIPESPQAFHTKGRGNGYVVEKDGVRVYIAGDTSATPEMRMLKDIDIALIPMNLPYTMSVEEAAEGVLAFKPKQVYPYHYRGPNGLSDVNKFKELVNAGDPNIDVVLRNWYPNQ
jgi:L-ascorbate metabolism protein UlaG (beta-lactamase superfamily)